MKKISMTDEARAAVRHKGPDDKKLLKALLSNEERDIPSSRHIRWMAFELLKARGWKLTFAYVGGKRTVLRNAILLPPGVKIKGRRTLDDVAIPAEVLW